MRSGLFVCERVVVFHGRSVKMAAASGVRAKRNDSLIVRESNALGIHMEKSIVTVASFYAVNEMLLDRLLGM